MKARILIVDDDLPVLLTLRAVLELNKFSVDSAMSAAEAIAKLHAATYDLVISDVHMSGKRDGLEVICAAKAQAYHPATALLTAHPPSDLNWQGNGAQSLLIKPVGTQELLRQIGELLERRPRGRIVSMEGNRQIRKDSFPPQNRRKAV